MCGLTGAVWRDGRSVPLELERAALAAIAHRGPDAKGTFAEGGVFLGHQRLAIIDLDPRSTQPMHRGSLSLVYNGEIYNYREIRTALEARGATFHTESDTEVVLAAFELDGIACLGTFEGMFAFAVWDRQRRELTLARDRFGEKPIAYLFDGERLLFGSEVPTILALCGNNRPRIDTEAVPLYFRFSYLPAPYGGFEGLNQLRPGEWLQLGVADWTVRRGFHFKVNDLVAGPRPAAPSFEGASAELRRRLTGSVAARMAASDVPVATFLSGGLDSSIVTTLASRVAGGEVTAYSVAFPDDPEFDESPYARLVADRLKNVRHHVVPVTESRLSSFTETTLARLGEPYADASLIPTAYLCAHVDEKVILGGDGADEVFGGYGVYSAMQMSARLPPWLKSMLMMVPPLGNPVAIKSPRLRAAALVRTHLHADPLEEYFSWRSYATAAQLEKLGLRPRLNHLREELAGLRSKSLRDLLATDIAFNLPADMLKKVDLASMQHGLEVRLPYLDSELVSFALSLPSEFLIGNGVRKRILRDAFAADLPSEILTRRKSGFLLPIRKWMKAGAIRDELLDLAAAQTSLDSSAVSAFAVEHRSGSRDNSQLLWTCYVYLKWMARHLGRSDGQGAGVNPGLREPALAQT